MEWETVRNSASVSNTDDIEVKVRYMLSHYLTVCDIEATINYKSIRVNIAFHLIFSWVKPREDNVRHEESTGFPWQDSKAKINEVGR